MYQIKLIDLFKHRTIIERSELRKIIPECSNYTIEKSLLWTGIQSEVSEIFVNYHKSTSTLKEHINLKGILEQCSLLLNEECIDKLRFFIPELAINHFPDLPTELAEEQDPNHHPSTKVGVQAQ